MVKTQSPGTPWLIFGKLWIVQYWRGRSGRSWRIRKGHWWVMWLRGIWGVTKTYGTRQSLLCGLSVSINHSLIWWSPAMWWSPFCHCLQKAYVLVGEETIWHWKVPPIQEKNGKWKMRGPYIIWGYRPLEKTSKRRWTCLGFWRIEGSCYKSLIWHFIPFLGPFPPALPCELLLQLN